MPRPANPIELVYSPSGEFPYMQWEEHLRTYRYFRVFGYNHFRSRFGLTDYSLVENDDIVRNAKEIVVREWSSALPPSHSTKDGIDLVGVNQVSRVRKNLPVAFQSACVAIVSLELALERANKSCDIYGDLAGDPHTISICPTVFQVDGYDDSFYQDNVVAQQNNLADLKRFTLQTQSMGKNSGDNVFKDMANNKLVTEWLAKRFVDFWRTRTPALASISVCKPRSGNSFRKPSQLEITVFPIP